MKTVVSWFRSKKQLKTRWIVLWYLLLCGMMLVFCVALQAGSLKNTMLNLLREPMLLLLNLFPILAVLGVLYALFGNLFYAASLSSLILHLLSLVNLIKIECRKDPLVPGDFGLLGEAMVATGEYKLNLHVPIVIAILLLAVGLWLLGIKYKTRPKLWLRLTAGVVAAGLFVGAMFTVYPSQELYTNMVKSVDGLSSSNVPAVFDETGFLYCFLHNFRLYEVQKPADYEAAEAAQWATQTAEPSKDGPLPVNVVFVQCEAYSDLFDADAFCYAPEDNPGYLFHQVAERPQAISGKLVVSNYGAGTANTEFDILTGVETVMLNENSTSALRVVYKKTDSLVRTFTSVGYQSWFMHPGQRWFYNRESTYDRLGFAAQTYFDDFGGYGWKGGYISDESFGQMLKERYEAHRAETDEPWFAFTVTIQNHQAYRWGRYDPDPPLAELSVDVSDETRKTLSTYAEGIRDSSILLEELTEYFDGDDAPTLLIFWGDHLPALGSSFSIYRELGLEIGNEADMEWALETYSTPYVIYANRAFCAQYDFEAKKEALSLPAGNRISDVYLGELVYELLDMQGTSAYFDFLSQIRRSLPVICRGRFMLPDGTLTEQLGDEDKALLRKLYCWGYYRIMDERITE